MGLSPGLHAAAHILLLVLLVPLCVAQQSSADAAVLLQQRDLFSNWDVFALANNISGWTAEAQPQLCTNWTGVGCDSGPPDASGVNLFRLHVCTPSDVSGVCGLPGSGNSGLTTGVFFNTSVQVAGQLSPGLGALQSLRVLDLYRSNIRGPPPDEWGRAGAFPRLISLNLQANKLQGTLPAVWGQQAAYPELVEIYLGSNRLSGSLPPEWGTGGGFRNLRKLYLEGNRIGGSQLPAEWGAPGAFPNLRELALNGNGFTGTLPSSWSGLPALRQLKLSDCPNITGPIPASWARLPLTSLTLAGTQVTGCVPTELANVTTFCSSPGPCPAALPACGTNTSSSSAVANSSSPDASSSSGSSSSSAPVGAIAGGVVGGIAVVALAVLAAVWWRRRHPAVAGHGADPEQGGKRAGAGGSVSSGSAKEPGSGHPAELDSFLVQHSLQHSVQHSVHSAKRTTSTSSPSVDSDPLVTLINSHLAALRTSTPPLIGSASSLSPETPAVQALPAPSPGRLLSPGSERGASRRSSLGRHPSDGMGMVDAQQFEVAWSDLQIGRRCGTGSFGRVYKARWNATPVAVKVLLDREALLEGSLALSPALLRSLQEEAKVMFRIRHPNVVQLMGICTMPACIITEFCARGSLYDVLRAAAQDPELAAQLTWDRRLGMAIDAATGMLHLHRRHPPIIHRDVKSPNLLVDQHWTTKVADFNLSKILRESEPEGSGGVSAPSTSAGATNPIWLAPEVLQGKKAVAASDVYAFGIVLYEMLTWTLPYSGMHSETGALFKIMRLVLAGQRPEVPPREDLPGPDTPTFAGLDGYLQLMRDCWAGEPEERPMFDAVIERLEELRALARPPSS